MLRLGAGISDLQQNIAKLRIENLDPAKAKEYQKLIEEWEEMDKTVQTNIAEINTKLKETEQDIGIVKEELENANATSAEIGNRVNTHGRKLENFEEKQKEQSTRIDELDTESIVQRTQLSSMESKQKTLEQDIRETSGLCKSLFSLFYKKKLIILSFFFYFIVSHQDRISLFFIPFRQRIRGFIFFYLLNIEKYSVYNLLQQISKLTFCYIKQL